MNLHLYKQTECLDRVSFKINKVESYKDLFFNEYLI